MIFFRDIIMTSKQTPAAILIRSHLIKYSIFHIHLSLQGERIRQMSVVFDFDSVGNSASILIKSHLHLLMLCACACV